MRGLPQGSLDALQGLEDDEGEPPAAAGHGVHLQVDVVDLAIRGEVLLDVSVLGLLQREFISELTLSFLYLERRMM